MTASSALNQVNDDLANLHMAIATVPVDIDALKQAESRLRQQIEALDRTQRTSGEVLAKLAHDLRNALAALRVAAQLLQSSADDPSAVVRTAGHMDGQLQAMARMVDDLADVAHRT